MTNASFDLKGRARQAMVDAGFKPDFPPEVSREVQLMPQQAPGSAVAFRDLRALLWSSIDNETSRDLDQVEYAEKLPTGGVRLLIGIADVDSSVRKGSATDQYAATETTSVYTGVTVFPMLPNELSTNLTSLVDAEDRASLVIELHVQDSGEVDHHDVYLALIRNRAKLAYPSTGAWLEGRGPMPQAIANVPGMEAQLRLQVETSNKLRGIRKQQGALTFGSIEATPVVENDTIKDLVLRQHNAAEDIIESFMVAANVALAQYLKEKRSLSIRRVVKTPQRWDRIQALAARYGTKIPDAPDQRALSVFLEQRKAADPDHFPDLSLSIVKLLGPGEYIVETPGTEREGHFGLAVHDYTHSTAPNRRFADLVTQRLIKAVMDRHPAGERQPSISSSADAPGGAAPYSATELSQIATRCTEREDAARKVERLMRKVAAACLLNRRLGESFDGIITGASPKGTYVRLLKFPAEGRIVKGANGCDVGDKVQVRLISVEIAKGFIDFERR